MQRRNFLKAAACLLPYLQTAGAAAAVEISQLTSSTASLSGLTFEEALKMIRKLGFSGVEILTFADGKHSVGPLPGVEVSLLTGPEKEHLRAEVGRLEHVSTHLPFYGMRPGATDPAVQQATYDRLHRAVDDSAYWGATMVTAHAASEPGASFEQIKPQLVSFFRGLGDHAAKYKMRLGIETGYPSTVKDYLSLIRDIDHDFVGGTIDTGHERAYRMDIGIDDSERATEKGARRYNDVLMEIVKGLGPKLFHFHVDDVRPSDWRDHRTLGSGLVDWTRLLGYLSQVNYRGMFAIELEEVPPIDQLAKSRAFFEQELRLANRLA
jgi:sugar phosphate isomerase/epimerase